MPTLTGDCSTDKPIIDVGLAPLLPRAMPVQAVPEASVFSVTPLRALLDTGADGTSITYSVVRQHNLLNYGKRRVASGGGENVHDTWAAFLEIFYEQVSEFEGEVSRTPAPFIIGDALLAIEIPDNPWFEVIIGRDVLTRFDFEMKRGKWKLELF
jgi:hypothetical protein